MVSLRELWQWVADLWNVLPQDYPTVIRLREIARQTEDRKCQIDATANLTIRHMQEIADLAKL